MGHCIQALIASGDSLRSGLKAFQHGHVIALNDDLSLAPITDEFFDEVMSRLHETAGDPFPRFERLSSSIAALASRLSVSVPVAYIETDYFGGTGTQSAVVWESGHIVVGPLTTTSEDDVGPSERAINTALRRLGVKVRRRFYTALRRLGIQTGCRHDEFAEVGLGRFRDNQDWIEQPNYQGRI